MKARVKATGDIVDATYRHTSGDGVKYYEIDKSGYMMMEDELDFDFPRDPDYWERLKHQYAGMAMQGYIIAAHLSHFSFCENDMKDCVSMATALVEKLKEEEK